MKNRKILAGVISVAVVGGILVTGCSVNKDETDNSTKAIVADTQADESEEADVTEITTTQEQAQEITINEQELVNQDGIVITAQEYVTDRIMGGGIKLNIQNNTQQNITVGCTALIVNNYMITDLFASNVAAGMQANDNLYLSSRELEAAGITNVGKVEIYFHIYDSDNWSKICDPECVTIQTSAYDSMDIVALDDGTELYNDGGIRIVGKAVDENSFWGSAILLYIENNSGRNVGINAQNMSINGYMVTPVFSANVYNERMAIDDITILRSELEENGIESIDTVQLSFRIYDSDNFSTIAETDTIEFSAR